MSRFGLDDKRYSTISRYVIATALVLAVVANVGVYLPQILSALAGAGAWVLAVVNPLVVGGLAACLLWPAVEKFDALLSRVRPLSSADRARHALSVVAVVLLAVAVLAVVVSVLLAFVTDSVRSVSLGNLAELADYVARSMSRAYDGIARAAATLGFSRAELEHAASAVAGVFGTSGASFGQTVTDGVGAVRDFVANGMLAVIFCVYFLIDAHNLATYWDRTLRSLMGTRAYGHLHAFALDVRRAFAGYMRGQFIDALLMGVAVTIALELVGVRYAVLIGLATGIGNLIPYVGPIVAYASTAVSCLVAGDVRTFALAVVVLAVIQFVDGQIVNPKILADSVEVHPILVIVALVVGGKVGGVVGMFVAVPCAALAKIYFEKYVAWRDARN